jgi:hypothetical protein
MDDSIEKRVYTLVSSERGVRLEKLAPKSTLSYDLGMEGDDAVEFFEEFGKEFAIDLKRLGEDWHCYFSPEGVTLSAGLLVGIPGSIIAIGLMKLFPRWPDWLCFVLAFLAWIAVLASWGNWRSRDLFAQITIQDLIDSAKAGKWIKDVPSDIKTKAAKRSLKYNGYGGPTHWFSP